MRLLSASALAAVLLASPAMAQDPSVRGPRPATISVSGTGEAELKPDFARVFVLVETQGDTVAKTVDQNRTSSEEVLARIQGLGIKKDDIRTENFQVFQTPLRADRNGNEIKQPKFTVHHRLRITTRDLSGVGRLAGEILASPNMLFQSVSFGLDRQEEGGDEARRAAVRDARRQAELYAEASGVSLGRILEIRDGSAQPYMERNDGMMRMQAMKAAPAEEVPIVPPATLRYTSGIQMVWEIAPKP
ncbi:SIMPL domain-containing protein [Microvirga pudoricolor]|uniref:SIMPL domain-containing protein n=1 Tax=Microvirga pudoricolor TaxID=2778729 RepID=UPI001951A16D|nr:SIMPL domain-containing protein [Microvirga pudoricolor]MBM6593832.1 SIMPL domain-containing protein [Microvirga pudoricolor]